ncbi:hypothetical protein MMC13_006699 [Lambiella insularis]|nr:hypothetical protein [Lambiella insularis]
MNSYALPQKLPRSKPVLPKRIVFSYICDYFIIVLGCIVFAALDAVEPFNQHFSLQNYTLQYPYAVHERVPVGLLYFVAIACPVIIIAFYTIVIDGIFSNHRHNVTASTGRKSMGRKYKLKHRLWELNCGILGLLLSLGAAYVITGTLKNATGKPRPDFIARCLPLQGSEDLPIFGLSNSTICTQSDKSVLKDGFRSFPSGHSSTSFAGLFYLSLYLAAKLQVLDHRGEVWKTLVVTIPTLGAALIAVSRIMDARHHPFDVISGSLLGILTAYYAYRQYFPPLSEAWRKGRAYPMRSRGAEPLGPTSAHAERGMARHLGVEPLRAAAAHDEEHTARDFPTDVMLPGPDLDPPSSGQNIFQKQIFHPSGASLHFPESPGTQMPSNAWPSTSRRGRPLHSGEEWPSSEDDGDETGYEMQPRHALGASHLGSHQLGLLEHPLRTFDQNTAYNPENYASQSHSEAFHQPLGHESTTAPASYIGAPQEHPTHR